MSFICSAVYLLNCSYLQALSSAAVEAIGMYHVPQGSYEMVKSLGIDTVEVMGEDVGTEELVKRLDAVKAAGLKALTGIYKWPFEPLKILPTINALANHPAVSYWYIIDEPDLHEVKPDTVRQINQFIHLSDIAKRPTFITISDLNYGPKRSNKAAVPAKAYGAYRDTADIIGVLRYGEPRKLRTYLKGYVFREFEGRRWWAVISLAQKPADLKKSVEFFLEGRPTGILYYAFSDEDKFFNLQEKPEIQEALREINFTIRGLPVPRSVAKNSIAVEASPMTFAPFVGASSGAPGGLLPGSTAMPSGFPANQGQIPMTGYPPGGPGAQPSPMTFAPQGMPPPSSAGSPVSTFNSPSAPGSAPFPSEQGVLFSSAPTMAPPPQPYGQTPSGWKKF